MARPKKETPSGDNYVYSTLANDQLYTTYQNSGDGTPAIAVYKVFVKGGAGVATSIANGVAGETPYGVVTVVSDEDLGHLEKNQSFLDHQKGGYLTVVKKQVDVEVAIADMNRMDKSAPITPEAMEKDGAEVSKDGNTITLPTVESDNV